MSASIFSQAMDNAGVTHHVDGSWAGGTSGCLRYVKREGRRGKGGHYVTRALSRWWCTQDIIPEGTRAAPGRRVDCLACLVSLPPVKETNPLPKPRVLPSTLSGVPAQAYSFDEHQTFREIQVRDASSGQSRVIRMPRARRRRFR